MLVSLKEIIDLAEKGNFAIPAFNVYNTETVMGVVKAAEEERAPVIIQVYPTTRLRRRSRQVFVK